MPLSPPASRALATPFGLLLVSSVGGFSSLRSLLSPLEEALPLALPPGCAVPMWAGERVGVCLLPRSEGGSAHTHALCELRLAPAPRVGAAGSLSLHPLWSGGLGAPPISACLTRRPASTPPSAPGSPHVVATTASCGRLTLVASDGWSAAVVAGDAGCVAPCGGDMLLLRTLSGRLRLMSPRGIVTEPRFMQPGGDALSRAEGVTRLEDACCGRVTLCFAHGGRTRASVCAAPAGGAAGGAVAALRCGAPPVACCNIERRFWGDPRVTAGGAADEWIAFSDAVRDWAAPGSVSYGAIARGGAVTAWDQLLRSPVHASAPHAVARLAPPPVAAPGVNRMGRVAPALRADVIQVLRSLHAASIEASLDALTAGFAPRIAALCCDLAAALGWGGWVDGYARAFGALPAFHHLLPMAQASPEPQGDSHPPSVEAWVGAVVSVARSGSESPQPPPLPPLPPPLPCCPLTSAVVAVFTRFASSGATHVAPCCVEAGLDGAAVARLPPSLGVPLAEAFAACRASPPAWWPPAAVALVGRPELVCDIATLAAACGATRASTSRLFSSFSLTPSECSPLFPAEPSPQGADPPAAGEWDAPPAAASDAAGAESDGMEGVAGAAGALRWTADGRLWVARAMLSSASPRPLRLREAADAGAEAAGAAQARLWAVAQRTGGCPVGRGALSLATHSPLPTEPLPVPHLNLSGTLPASQNAVINLDVGAQGAGAEWVTWPEFHNGAAAGLRLRPGAPLSRTWVLSNRPSPAAPPSPVHAGLLLALGLGGFLTHLAPADVFKYLAAEHAPTSVGVLLGTAASRVGTCHAATAKMLLLHLPARHPASLPDIELPPVVQAAALLGLGLLHCGRGGRAVAEVLASELARPPGGEAEAEGREGHALAAGLALGMLTLGRGRTDSDLQDLGLAANLGGLMRGARAPQSPHAPPPASATPLRQPEAVPPPGGGLLMEGRGVALGVRAGGAALALGLLFHRTSDSGASALCELPTTRAGLDGVRPELLLLRVVSRALIEWDSIQPTAEWVHAQLPPILVAGLSPGGSPGVGSAAAQARAGACLALGLRFAGTAHGGAAALLSSHIQLFAELKRKPTAEGRADKHTLETGIAAACLALGCVLAGTGDLDAMRLLRRLRRRVDAPGAGGITYGTQMALSQALGFLFLGAGAATFDASPQSVACLLASILPPYAAVSPDNKGHLQAARHLYALAARPARVSALDAARAAPAAAPVTVRMACGDERAACCPFLAVDGANTVALSVHGPRHWEHSVTGPRLAEVLAAGALPVAEKPGWRHEEEEEDATDGDGNDAASPSPLSLESDAPFAQRATAAAAAGGTEAGVPATRAVHRCAEAAAEGGPPDPHAPARLAACRLLTAWYGGELRASWLPGVEPLVGRTFLGACGDTAADAARGLPTLRDDLREYIRGEAPPPPRLGAFLDHFGVPPRAALRAGLAAALTAAANDTQQALPIEVVQALVA